MIQHVGKFTAYMKPLNQSIAVDVKREVTEHSATLRAMIGGDKSGYLMRVKRPLQIPTTGTKSFLTLTHDTNSKPSLYQTFVYHIQRLVGPKVEGVHKGVKGIGTNLLYTAIEDSFRKNYHGYTTLSAEDITKSGRHPALFYYQRGFKPAFSFGKEGNGLAQATEEALAQGVKTGVFIRPHHVPEAIPMALQEGLGQTALAARKKAMEEGLSLSETLDRILRTAPEGTKGNTMHHLSWRRNILDDTTKALDAGTLVIGHPSITPAFSKISPQAKIWD